MEEGADQEVDLDHLTVMLVGGKVVADYGQAVKAVYPGAHPQGGKGVQDVLYPQFLESG